MSKAAVRRASQRVVSDEFQFEEQSSVRQKSNSLKIRLDDMSTISPLTENQKKFFDAYKIGDYFIMLLGSAGTGKTYISLYKALEEVLDKGNPFGKIVIVRSNVQSRDMGHLPGNEAEKMALYEQPYIQICAELFGRKDAYERLKEQGYIEFVSTSFIRGMTFNYSIIIVDECQNQSWEELSTIITRAGHNSKIIFSGDYRQNDLTKKSSDKSGLDKFHKVARKMSACTEIEFTTEDICRSSLVKEFIIALEEYEKEHEPNR